MKTKLLLLLLATLLLAAPLASAQTELSMWYHGGAWAAEHQVFIDLIAAFNESQSDYEVILEAFPQESYNSSIVAAAAAGELPDIIDVDG
ncbi:MAG: sugar ABC transporter substrate-binding protein, partial [Chloroflexota bacterium]|nr:sugar ABC transporter substrate-binding protein [Chloroflexota bacterium]